MGFHETLIESTREDADRLFELPFVRHAVRGTITLGEYLAFLTAAYHHVRHTVPLLMATGAALRDTQSWLLPALCEYVAEEKGHEEWILSDIAACGENADAVRRGAPSFAVEMMIAYAYDCVARRNPIGFFGMVHVLEGSSVRGATDAADAIQSSLDLPNEAMTYLRSHGSLDLEHVAFFRNLMNRVRDLEDQRWIIHCAKAFYRLYGGVFLSLKPERLRVSVSHEEIP